VAKPVVVKAKIAAQEIYASEKPSKSQLAVAERYLRVADRAVALGWITESDLNKEVAKYAQVQKAENLITSVHNIIAKIESEASSNTQTDMETLEALRRQLQNLGNDTGLPAVTQSEVTSAISKIDTAIETARIALAKKEQETKQAEVQPELSSWTTDFAATYSEMYDLQAA